MKQIILKLILVTVWAVALLGVGFAGGAGHGYDNGYEDGLVDGRRRADARAVSALQELETTLTAAVCAAVQDGKRKLDD